MQALSITPQPTSLSQVVCNWSPTNLQHLAKSFSDSCAPPETTFSSYHNYKAYFEPLLFAEISAELLSATLKFQRATSLRVTKVRARREEPGTTLAVVTVQKVTRVHNLGFGWSVDVESHDRRGPVGCVDSDVVAVWPAQQQQQHNQGRNFNSSRVPSQHGPRQIPECAVLSVVVRTINRTGCRFVTAKFPDGNEHGLQNCNDLEDGEQNEQQAPRIRLWNVLRVGSLTTMKREFSALQNIKSSVLLPKILRPNLQQQHAGEKDSSVVASDETSHKSSSSGDPSSNRPPTEHIFGGVVAEKTGLNSSQTRAIVHASTCRSGFSVIQGPPGTGKTRTLISLLNVIHIAQYQQYYEGLLATFDPLHRSSSDRSADVTKPALSGMLQRPAGSEKSNNEGSLLETMMDAMNKTVAITADHKANLLSTRFSRPRLLICAPSNSAVDEILTRLTRCKFVDGQGREYCPELARIGAGDRVSEAAKPFTAEGQAESFLDRVCGEEMTPEAQKKAQMSFLGTWQGKCNALLVQLERTPKKDLASRPVIIDIHEKLERMDRDLRRLRIAASDGSKAIKREEKLRSIARTYVEDAQLVFATLSGSASSILTKKGSYDVFEKESALFDTVVIDEGAQATEPACLIPMTLGATRCILVGDPQQLPATVLSSGAAGLAYGQSLLERVCRAGQNILLLDTQYRMHPAISSFPRRYFYNGRLVDDESVQGENRARPYHRDVVRPKLGPYVFLDISEGEERRSTDDRSVFNSAEAELASLIYSKLKKEYAKDSLFSPAAKTHGSVTGFGVVTPYKRQMQELRQSFDRAGIPTGDVEIDTVDSFQGREKDVIVFSCVRTAAVNRGIGFVRDVRRMNVGLTRARASLIILGSAQALAEGSADWAELVEDANSRGCLISVTNVSRCLQPPSLYKKLMIQDDPEKRRDEDSEMPTRPQISTETHRDTFHVPTQKSGHGSLPSDPRRRAHKGDSLRSSDISKGQDHPTSMKGDISAENSVASHAEMDIVTKGLRSGSLISRQPSTAPKDTNAGLHSTLQQMTSIFSDAGFQNTKAVEETLREHVNNGGALDLETVMAAAIATGNSNQNERSDKAKTALAVPMPISAGDGRHEDRSEAPIGRSATLPNGSMRGDGNIESIKPHPQPDNSNNKSKIEENGSELSLPEGAAKAHVDKKHKKMKKKENSATSPVRQEPSGWDMLFTHGTSSGEDIKLDEVQNNEAARGSKGESHARGCKPASEIVPAQPNAVKSEASWEMNQYGSAKSSPSPSSFATEKGGMNMKGKDGSYSGSNFKRNWNDKGRDERKRPRSGDYAHGNGPRTISREIERGRGRMRGSREGHASNLVDQEQSIPDYMNGGGVVWDPRMQFDRNMNGFPVMANVMEQEMANAQVLNPVHAMQQQALQQQVLQQQVLQQQAMQQQLFQQQAMQHHHQAFQQQALQQQALQQQAVLLQMGAAGIPHTGMAPNAYTGVDFDSFDLGAVRGPVPSNMDNSNWTRGNSHNRYSRGGSGRGRQKRGGRGRRPG